MANRLTGVQSLHDSAVYAAQDIYQKAGITVWINPGTQQNKSWRGYYIDVIVASNPEGTSAWVIEVETEDSVTLSEAQNQWKTYGRVYDNWHLAVPRGLESKARQLLAGQGVSNCTVISWEQKSNGLFTYWGLPGLK